MTRGRPFHSLVAGVLLLSWAAALMGAWMPHRSAEPTMVPEAGAWGEIAVVLADHCLNGVDPAGDEQLPRPLGDAICLACILTVSPSLCGTAPALSPPVRVARVAYALPADFRVRPADRPSPAARGPPSPLV